MARGRFDVAGLTGRSCISGIFLPSPSDMRWGQWAVMSPLGSYIDVAGLALFCLPLRWGQWAVMSPLGVTYLDVAFLAGRWEISYPPKMGSYPTNPI